MDFIMNLPREIPTAFNKAPIVRAVTALLMVISILATITRVMMKLMTTRGLTVDDCFLSAATVVAVVQSILVICQGRGHGIGIHHNVLQGGELATSQKLEYASNVLFVLCVALAKLSATRTLLFLSMETHAVAVFIIEAVVAVWAVASIFTLLFQCHLPRPWDYTTGQCIHQASFWTSFDVINIVTDLAIIAVTFHIFKSLRTNRSRKLLVIFVFGSRILNTPPIVFHIIYFNQVANSSDHTFDIWIPTIILQVIQCMSILTTCLPNLVPFLDIVQSGQMHPGELPQSRSKHSTSDRGYSSVPSSRGGSRAHAFNATSEFSNGRQSDMYELANIDASLDNQEVPTASAPRKSPMLLQN